MSRWNAATQRWLSGRELLRAIEEQGACGSSVALARAHTKALEFDMDCAEVAYFEAVRCERKVA
jgi:hypothetical protein